MTPQGSRNCDFSLIYRILDMNIIYARDSIHIKEINGETAVVSYKQKVISANICNITVKFESRICAESKYV